MLGPLTLSAFGTFPTMVLAQTTNPPASTVIAPALLFVLCVIAAIGVILLLPGRREATLRRIGAVVLAAAGIVFAALLARTAGGMGAYFWIFAALAILGAIRVITHTRPVYSALYFVLTVMASAGLFVLMWAEFMAAALILIYAGAILVTYVFVIMLAAEAQPAGQGAALSEQLAEHDAISREPLLASAVGFALLGMLLFVIFDRASLRAPGETASAGEATFAVTSATPFSEPEAALQQVLRTRDITSEVFTAPVVQPTTQQFSGGTNAPIDRADFTSSKNLSYSYQAPHASTQAVGAGFKLSEAVGAEFAVAADIGVLAPATAPATTQSASGFVPHGQTQRLGAYLFDKQIVNLELAGLILTVAMVGAIVIARKRVVSTEPAFARRAPTETLTAPMTPVDDNPHSIPVYGTENPRQKEYPET